MKKALLIVVLSFVVTVCGYWALNVYAGACCGLYQDCLCSGEASVNGCTVDFFVYSEHGQSEPPYLKFWFTDDVNNPVTLTTVWISDSIVCSKYGKNVAFDRNGTIEYFFFYGNVNSPNCRDPDLGTHLVYLTNCK